MELWLSGEISKDVDKPFHTISNELEKKINKLISRKDFGSGLVSWDVIALIAGPEWTVGSEVRKYSKRKKECEYRVKVDHEAFLNGSRRIQVNLLFGALIETINDLGQKDILDFDFDSLLSDLNQLGKQHGW